METYKVVQTNSGPVKGLLKRTEFGNNYYSFQHIPYVQQSVEESFKDPKPVKPWNDVLDCTHEGSPAYSYDHFLPEGTRYMGGDNCLGVNVFTPDVIYITFAFIDIMILNIIFYTQLFPSKLLPVFVWIHGGAFTVGSSSTDLYGPEFIVEKDVIMVSMNYRLGIFGFLSLKDPKVGVPGNAGLKDQFMALKWTKENIARFGGDPNNITLSGIYFAKNYFKTEEKLFCYLIGESAGSASVHYHMISPMSKGLFNKAILVSASSLCPWAYAPSKYPSYLKKVAIELGLSENADDSTIFNALTNADPKKLLDIDHTLVPSQVLNLLLYCSSFHQHEIFVGKNIWDSVNVSVRSSSRTIYQ